jgi:hypothetical protein
MANRNAITPNNLISLFPISFGPDVLAGLVHLTTHKRSQLAVPEKALMFAVLADAVETYQKYACSRSRRSQILFREAEEWFWNKETGYLFSFPSICEALGFDTAFFRLGLMRWTENQRADLRPHKKTQVHCVRSRVRKPLSRQHGHAPAPVRI